jgi:hypothetical protein
MIVGEAAYEGLADREYRGIAGLIEFVHRAIETLLILAYIGGIYFFSIETKPFLEVVVGFLFVRYALFDVVYNLTVGKEIFYIGFTKWYDKAWRWFFGWSHFPEHFLAITKFILLCWGIAWLI